MSCNVLHPQCWQQARWIGAGGARKMHSGATVRKKAQMGLSRTAASTAERASEVLPWGEKEGREPAAAAGRLSYTGGWCRCRLACPFFRAWEEGGPLSGDIAASSWPPSSFSSFVSLNGPRNMRPDSVVFTSG